MSGSSACSGSRKTEEAEDHRQNNSYMLRQWGPRQCEATSVYSANGCSNCVRNSGKGNVRSTAGARPWIWVHGQDRQAKEIEALETSIT